MAESPTKAGTDRFEVRLTTDSHFGWIRTHLSLEHTMMSWIRTAIALVGFGFAIVQFLSHLAQAPGARGAYLPGAPGYLGLALIASGVVPLLIPIWQNRWGICYLSSGSFSAVAGVKEGRIQTPVLAVAILLFFTGLFAFFAALLRLA